MLRVLRILKTRRPSVIVAGSAASASDGFSLLREIRALYPETPVVLVTDQGSIEMALNAIQQEGAYHYFEKPVDGDKLRIILDRAVELSEAKARKRAAPAATPGSRGIR